MKQTMKKIGALVMAFAMIVSMVSFPTQVKADNMKSGEVLYLKPNSNWLGGARFACYFYGPNDKNTWVSMTPVYYGIYEAVVPTGDWTNVIFCRMNSGSLTNSWDNVGGNGPFWNKTNDLTFDGTNNLYTIAEGAWDKGDGSWSTLSSLTEHMYVDKGDGKCLFCGKECGKMIYFEPQNGNGRFAVYYYVNNDVNRWAELTELESSGVYKIMIPKDSDFIFCAMKPDTIGLNWESVGTQTEDLSWNGNKNYFKITGTSNNGKFAGEWSHKCETATYADGCCADCHKDANGDSYCDKSEKIMEGCVVAKKYTLTLDGKIGVNFYMDIASDVLNDSNANVVFTFNGVADNPIPVKNGVEKDGYRVFTYYVAAKEMTDAITAEVVTKVGENKKVLATCTVSVMEYAKTILTDDKYKNERELVKAMLRYGAYSQTYFKDYNKENKADSILKTLFPEETDPVTSYKIDGKYMPAATAPTTKYSATSLLLESDVVLRHYFNDNENVGGTETKDGYYYIDIDSIPAHELSVGKTINVDNVDITYSPFNYAYTVLNDKKEDLALENLMKAMCMYGDAAYAYKNPQQ